MFWDINRHWYRSSVTWLTLLLLPLSWIFRLVVKVRRALYRAGIKKVSRFDVPVIVVGNITVGGTGKTPFVLWLAEFLTQQGFRPGIVSRGYGGKKHSAAIYITHETSAHEVGDEAIMLARRAGCPVVICVDRVAAVKELLDTMHCDIVISDDGLQHYRLGRDIEIALVDGKRRFGNQYLLPAGPLREPVKRLSEVDFVVAQQNPLPGEFEMSLHGDKLVSVKNSDSKVPIQDFSHQKVHGVAAIANPERFFAALGSYEIDVIKHSFLDHYLYKSADFNFKDKFPIVMTEKDAVKCKKFADEKFWYLPVRAIVDAAFGEALLRKINLMV
jgi:tetraacyldisaccharide 4'-kinase